MTDPTLREGDSGAAVSQMQQLLKNKKFYLKNVDGMFGKITKDSVILFQQSRGLAADGIVGSATWTALRKEIVPAPTPIIKLVDVCNSYNGAKYPHQTKALEWLQAQISSAELEEFAKRWRNDVSKTTTSA